MSENTCRHCKHSKDTGQFRECRLNGPIYTKNDPAFKWTSGTWPTVNHDDWCSSFGPADDHCETCGGTGCMDCGELESVQPPIS